MFGIAFWNLSKRVNYEKTLRDSLIISAYGFILLFLANQSTTLTLTPYPPYGVSAAITLIIGAYLIMVGIYTSALMVSMDRKLRNSIHNLTKESRLIDYIGKAEMEKEVTRIVNNAIRESKTSEPISPSLELNEQLLKQYMSEVAEELKKKKTN